MSFGKLYTEATRWHMPYVPPKRLARVQDWVYQEILDKAAVIRYGKSLREMSPSDATNAIETMTQTPIKNALKKKGNRALEKALEQTYFPNVPIKEIIKALHKVGLVILQEDSTGWEGFITGKSGKMLVPLAPTETETNYKGVKFFTPFTNTQFVMTWHKMDSGTFEVIAYVS